MKEFKMKINGNDYSVTIKNVEDNVAEVEVNGKPYSVTMDTPMKKTASARPAAIAKPVAAPAATVAAAKPAAGGAGGGAIKSPLPGIILDIMVKVGDDVKTGQKVCMLEAMKMENSINSDIDGKVIAIKVNKGDSVMEGTDLIIIG